MNTNPKTVKIKPRDGLTVRHPDTRRPLAEKGEKVEMNSYWQRRLNDGDVLVVARKTGPQNGGNKS